MDKVVEWMGMIPKDKLLHSFYGVLLYSVLAFFGSELAIVTVIVVALLKEVWDEYSHRSADFVDVIATVVLPLVLYVREVVM